MAKPELSAEEQAGLNEVLAAKKTAEDYLQPYRTRCDELYGHYRGYKGLSYDLQAATPPDRDIRWRDAQNEWGSELVIPRAFEVVETILPRAVSNRPRMLVLPVDDQAESNVENMRYLLDQQQQRIQYELKLEETAKNGFIYGIGFQKLLWETRYGTRPSMKQGLIVNDQGQTVPQWFEGPPIRERIFDDWTVEPIHPNDMLWDPYGFKIEEGAHGSCRYLIHKLRLDSRQVMERLRDGRWSTAAAQVLEDDDVRSLANNRAWDAYRTQSRAAGFTNSPNPEGMHEVLEFHHEDGRVITVLDSQIPVAMGRNPYRHAQMPFSVFRPSTAGIPQLAGIGVIEPIEQLLREMSTLRSQRRDNAAIKLAQVFAYSDGAIDQNDLQFFPGAAIPVHGEPRDFLYPIQVGDIPNSSYNEEDRINQDMDRVTGISDTVTGADASQGAASTATGVQLVQAAANVRIQRQTKRLELELVTRECGQAVSLNQQKIIQAQQRMLKIPRLPEPGETGPVFDSRLLTPPELMGRFAINVDAGSMAPKNMPQQIQLAQAMGNDFGQDPSIDQTALTRRKLELYGVAHPEAFMVSQAPPLDPDILNRLAQSGVDQALIEAAVQASQRENPPAGVADGAQGGQQQQSQNGNQPDQQGAPA